MQHARSRPLITTGFVVFAASMLLNLSGFLFHALVSRKLGVQQYGEFYALVAAYSIASLPAQFFAPVVTKFAAEFLVLHDEAHMRGLFRGVATIFAGLGICYVVATFLFAGTLSAYLHTAPSLVILTGLMSAIGVTSAITRAFGQGIQQFGLYAISLYAEAFGKISVLMLASCFVLSIHTVVGAFLVGIAAGLVALFFPLRRSLGSGPTARVYLYWRRIMLTIAGAASISFAGMGIGFADVIIVKHFFSAQEAGLYSAASLGGKMLLYFLGFIPTLLLSHAAHTHAKGESTRSALLTALAVTISAGVAGIVIYSLFGRMVLHALVGANFDAALPLMIGYVVAMTFMATANALASYALATHRMNFALPLALATTLTIGVMSKFHASLMMVVYEMIAATALMFVIVAVSLIFQKNGKPARLTNVLDSLITTSHNSTADTRS